MRTPIVSDPARAPIATAAVRTPIGCASIVAALSLVLALALAGALAGDASPGPHRRVVVLRFEGPRQLAEDARALVLDVAAAENDVVALGRWADAHRTASRRSRGVRAWAASAREAGVDAIVEGSVRRGRRGYALELVVREASTGNQVDSVEVHVDDERRAARELEAELTDLLAWIEPPAESRALERLDRRNDRDDRWREDDRDDRWREDDRDDRRRDDDRDDRWRDDDRDDDRRRDDRSRDREEDRWRDARDDDRWRDDRDDDRRRRDRDDDRVDDRDELGFRDERNDRDRELDDRELAEETIALLDGEHERAREAAPARSPLVRVAGGAYVASRSLGLRSASASPVPGGDGGHPTVGVAVGAELFPFAERGAGPRLTGLGLQLELARGVGNRVVAEVDGRPAQLPVAQGGWSIALAYRRPLGPAVLQLDLGYGASTQRLEGKPASVPVVDADYAFLRAGGEVELPVTPRATLVATAHYLYLTAAPAMQALGAPSASGLDAGAALHVPLTARLSAVGAVDYQRITLGFASTSTSSDTPAAATDALVSARLALAVTY